VMFYGCAAIGRDHCVQKERPRIKIDHRRTDDAHGTNFGALEIRCRHWSAHVPLPDNTSINTVQRIHIVRLRHCNDHWAVWTALDVKRLSVNVAYDRTVKA